MNWTRQPGVRWLGALALLVLVILTGWMIGRSAKSASDAAAVTDKQPDQKIYRDIAAQVIRLSPQEKSITLDHEEIPGFMAAMRMDMPVAHASDVADLKPGDRVLFDLVHFGNDYVASGFRKTSASSQPTPQDTHADDKPADALGRGDLIPDISLINAQGKATSLYALPGKHKVITFFYARCPHEQFCPAQTKQLATLQEYLNAGQRDIHLVSLTLDAAHDNPQVLAGYAERFKIDPSRWTLAGCDDAQTIRTLANRLGARINKHADGFQIDHALIGVRVDGQRIVDLAYGLEAIERMVRGM